MSSIDQLGETVEINYPPKRIISLVPSQTEFLFDLGLDEEMVGITRFCIHPKEKADAKDKIGGTKQFDIEKIKSLQPDLIIGNKEENYAEGINELKQHFPVWMSDIYTVDDAYAMMNEVSRIVNRHAEGKSIIEEIKASLAQLQVSNSGISTCAYFIWRKPYMVAGSNTFIHHMLELFGMKNVFESEMRYPEINPVALSELNPDYIFLSTEPYSFGEKHYEEFKSFSPDSKVVLVDGEMFSWYGSRLRQAGIYFSGLRSKLQLAADQSE